MLKFLKKQLTAKSCLQKYYLVEIKYVQFCLILFLIEIDVLKINHSIAHIHSMQVFHDFTHWSDKIICLFHIYELSNVFWVEVHKLIVSINFYLVAIIAVIVNIMNFWTLVAKHNFPYKFHILVYLLYVLQILFDIDLLTNEVPLKLLGSLQMLQYFHMLVEPNSILLMLFRQFYVVYNIVDVLIVHSCGRLIALSWQSRRFSLCDDLTLRLEWAHALIWRYILHVAELG